MLRCIAEVPLAQLATIFLNVLVPVFCLVGLGYLIGPRLQIESRTLSRFSFYILTPAYIIDTLSTAQIAPVLAARMTLYTAVVHVGCALLALVIALLLRRSPQMVAAYVLIAVFGNVGNFGLPIVQFAYGPDAQGIATVYFLAILTLSLIIGLGAATWNTGGRLQSIITVLCTPAIIALAPALLINTFDITLPVPIARIFTLLASALVPVMLIALGVQLTTVTQWSFTSDTLIVTAIRLLGGAALAVALAPLFDIGGIERNIGVLQAAMPTAVLASIIAIEHDLLPDFVISAVLFSTLASVLTLTIILSLLGV